MKKLLTTSALTLVLATSNVTRIAHAQSKNFEGAYVSFGGGAVNTESKANLNSPAATPTATAAGGAAQGTVETNFVGFNTAATTILSRTAQAIKNRETDFVGTASLGYNFALDQNFLIGIDLSGRSGGGTQSIAIAQPTISTVSKGTTAELSSIITNTTGTSSLKIKDKMAYALSIKPTYVVDKDLAIYGKLGYGFTTLEAKYTADGAAAHRSEKTVEGHTIGLGATYIINKQTFLDFGFDYTDNKKFSMSKNDSSVTPALTSLTLTSVSHTLSETIDSTSMGAFVKVGMKF